MRDDPPEEISVEEYLKLEEAKPKKKAKVKEPRKPPDPPVYCAKCGKRITFEHSTANPVKDGKAEHFHWECYYGEKNDDKQ